MFLKMFIRLRAFSRRPALALTFALVLTAPLALAACSQEPSGPIPFTEVAVVEGNPGSFTIVWRAPDPVTTVKVYAGTDPNNVGHEREVGAGSANGHVVVSLPAGPRWYFEFVPDTGGALVMTDHRIPLVSLPNTRDIGGYRTTDGRWVRMGRVFRSAQLDAVSDEDYDVLQSLGLNLICDLRTGDERTRAPSRLPEGADVLVANVNGDGPDGLGGQLGDTSDIAALLAERTGEEILDLSNRAYVTSAPARTAYGTLFARLADPASLPTLIHCTSGKDRTGWASAALLTLLGVPEDMVMFDYMRSNRALTPRNRAILASAPPELGEAMIPLLTAREEYLRAAFEEVTSTYGNIEGYFKEGLGLSEETIAALKANFLTP